MSIAEPYSRGQLRVKLQLYMDDWQWHTRQELVEYLGHYIPSDIALREYLNTIHLEDRADHSLEHDSDIVWAVQVGRGRIMRMALTRLHCERQGTGPNALYRLP